MMPDPEISVALEAGDVAPRETVAGGKPGKPERGG